MSASSRWLGKNKATSVYGPGESVRAIFAISSYIWSATHIRQTQWIPSLLVRLAFCLQSFAYFDNYFQQLIHVSLFFSMKNQNKVSFLSK